MQEKSTRWVVAGLGALIVVSFAGCKTMDIAAMKSKIGLGGTETKTVAAPESSVKPGPKPVSKTVASSPIVPPSDIKPPASPSPALQTLITSEALAKEYNGVLVSFLGSEAKRWMREQERKMALDQAVTALKAKIEIAGNEQIETSLGAAVGMAMQLADDGIVGEAGESVAGDYFSEISGWIDAAADLAELGYTEESSAFFEYGMKSFAHDTHRGRCVAGYAKVHPDKAYAFLSGKLQDNSTAEKKVAIRMLGHLASTEELDADTKTQCIETIAAYAQGMMNATYYPDAIYALGVCNDPRAVPALKTFSKGMMVSDEQQRPALTSLALNYGDAEAIKVLKGIVNAGMMATYDWRDKQFAFRILVRAGDDAGYTYAQKMLTKKSKGLFAAKDKPDLRSEIVTTLMRYGDARGAKVMASAFDQYPDDEWVKTWMATSMMLLGDSSAMEFAKSKISMPGWEFTAVSIAQALAKYGDYSGIERLRALISLREVPPAPGTRVMKALAGANDESKERAARLARLRGKIAYSLGQIDHTSCIPLLEIMLGDQAESVRRAAATALVSLSVSEAIPVMVRALDVRYGILKEQQLDTTPITHARLVRAGGNRWGTDPRVTPLLTKAASSKYASVKLIGLAMQR